MQPYLVIDFTVDPPEPGRDILLATLDLEGFESFEETETGLKAYILEDDFNEEDLLKLPVFSSPEFNISYIKDKLENKNWNEEWETHYEPIELNKQVYIRAPFHEKNSEFDYQIEIMPKMSFGTGHHQTTRLMCSLILDLDLRDKLVLDMGTGTGILAILASMLGAEKVEAIDNFEWAVENTAENAERNGCSNIKVFFGDASALANKNFDVVLANINRNVLLEDMKSYVETLPLNGQMAISGFFEEDFDLLNNTITSMGLDFNRKIQEGRWIACLYKKTKIIHGK